MIDFQDKNSSLYNYQTVILNSKYFSINLYIIYQLIDKKLDIV